MTECYKDNIDIFSDDELYIEGLSILSGLALSWSRHKYYYINPSDYVSGSLKILCDLVERYDPEIGSFKTFAWHAFTRRFIQLDLSHKRYIESCKDYSTYISIKNYPSLKPDTILKLRFALRIMPEHSREIIRLAYYEDHKQYEIAEIKKKERHTIGRYHKQAIDTLKNNYEQLELYFNG